MVGYADSLATVLHLIQATYYIAHMSTFFRALLTSWLIWGKFGLAYSSYTMFVFLQQYKNHYITLTNT